MKTLKQSLTPVKICTGLVAFLVAIPFGALQAIAAPIDFAVEEARRPEMHPESAGKAPEVKKEARSNHEEFLNSSPLEHPKENPMTGPRDTERPKEKNPGEPPVVPYPKPGSKDNHEIMPTSVPFEHPGKRPSKTVVNATGVPDGPRNTEKPKETLRRSVLNVPGGQLIITFDENKNPTEATLKYRDRVLVYSNLIRTKKNINYETMVWYPGEVIWSGEVDAQGNYSVIYGTLKETIHPIRREEPPQAGYGPQPIFSFPIEPIKKAHDASTTSTAAGPRDTERPKEQGRTLMVRGEGFVTTIVLDKSGNPISATRIYRDETGLTTSVTYGNLRLEVEVFKPMPLAGGVVLWSSREGGLPRRIVGTILATSN